MESPAPRTTSWTAAWLLAEAWCLYVAGGAVEPITEFSSRGIFGAPRWVPPSWLVPALDWGVVVAVVLAALLLLRTRLTPPPALLRWQTTYFLWLAIPCTLHAGVMVAGGRDVAGPGLGGNGTMIAGIYALGARVFLPLGLLLLGTWWLRRNGSRFAGTATAASHLALAGFVPAGPLAILSWWRIVRPVEERPAA